MKKPKNEAIVDVEPLEVSSSSLWFETASEWVHENKTTLLYGALSLIAALFLLLQWNTRSEKAKMQEFQQIPQQYDAFSAGTLTLNSFEEALKAAPSLEAKYAPLIAETLLVQGKNSDAAPYIEKTVSTLETAPLPEYSSFGTATKLLAEGKLAEALSISKKLQESVSGYESAFSVLNNLRIIGIYHALGDTAAEKEAIKTLLAANKEISSPKALRQILSETRVGKLTLENYLKAQL